MVSFTLQLLLLTLLPATFAQVITPAPIPPSMHDLVRRQNLNPGGECQKEVPGCTEFPQMVLDCSSSYTGNAITGYPHCLCTTGYWSAITACFACQKTQVTYSGANLVNSQFNSAYSLGTSLCKDQGVNVATPGSGSSPTSAASGGGDAGGDAGGSAPRGKAVQVEQKWLIVMGLGVSSFFIMCWL